MLNDTSMYEFSGDLSDLTDGGSVILDARDRRVRPLKAHRRVGRRPQECDDVMASPEYLGEGTISSLGGVGLRMDHRPVVLYRAQSRMMLYVPGGLPVNEPLSIGIDLDACLFPDEPVFHIPPVQEGAA